MLEQSITQLVPNFKYHEKAFILAFLLDICGEKGNIKAKEQHDKRIRLLLF